LDFQNTSAHNREALDLVLTDIANSIQLSASDYDKAQSRYNAVADHLHSDSSKVAQFDPKIYPQGSFRTQTTISSSDAEDEFDIDLMLELKIRRDNDPDVVLDAVINSLSNRSDWRVVKKRRCVTIEYPDNMHLDITPSVLLDSSLPPRPSQIFDAHPARVDHVIADPEGFARWFDKWILPAEIFEARMTSLKADAAPVPEQKPLSEKPNRLLALQLLKRWRDRQHENKGGDKIPSVLLSKYVAEFTSANEDSLYEMMVELSSYLFNVMSTPLGVVSNPACSDDVLTDRWPGESGIGEMAPNQSKFREDLEVLIGELRELAERPISDNRKLMDRLFGERATERGSTALAAGLVASTAQMPDDNTLVQAIKRQGIAFLDRLNISVPYEEAPPWKFGGNIPVSVTATVHPHKDGEMISSLQSGQPVLAGRWLCFQAHPGFGALPKKSKVHWRITNTGMQAAFKRQTRGKFADTTGLVRWEATVFVGVHWVQAFVVNEQGRCIGSSDRFYVVVEPS